MGAILGGAALIFAMRVCDVTLGTVRQIMAVQGRALFAATIGFFELIIFILAISKTILSVQESMVYVFAYAGGFAVGTLAGVRLEAMIGLGTRLIRVIAVSKNRELVAALRAAGFGVTVVPAEGMNGPVEMLFSVVKRRNVGAYQAMVRQHAPRAFCTVEEMRQSLGGQLGGQLGGRKGI